MSLSLCLRSLPLPRLVPLFPAWGSTSLHECAFSIYVLHLHSGAAPLDLVWYPRDAMSAAAGNGEASGAAQSSSQGPRTRPNCARCRNHDHRNPLKGHKRFCKFRKCACKKCVLLIKKRKLMAEQTALRREQQQDEILRMSGINPSEHPSLRSVSPSPVSSPLGNSPSPSSNGTMFNLNSTYISPATPTFLHTAPIPSGSSDEVHWDSIRAVQEKFMYRLDTSALLQIILERVSSNVTCVCNLIVEAQYKLKQIRLKEENGRQVVRGVVKEGGVGVDLKESRMKEEVEVVGGGGGGGVGGGGGGPLLDYNAAPYYPLSSSATPYNHPLPSYFYHHYLSALDALSGSTTPCGIPPYRHENSLPFVVNYGFPKFDHKNRSPTSLHSEEQATFNQVNV